MLSVQKSLRLALVAAIAFVVSAAESQAAVPRNVFGKEPVARFYRASNAKKAQPSSGYRMMASNSTRMMPSTQSYGGTAMVTVMLGFGLLMNVGIHRDVRISRQGESRLG